MSSEIGAEIIFLFAKIATWWYKDMFRYTLLRTLSYIERLVLNFNLSAGIVRINGRA